MLLRLFFIPLILILQISCSKEPVYQPSLKKDPFIIYQEAYDAFEVNDYFNASKKFLEAETYFENIELATKSSMMSIFSLYGINFYDEALENIERFKKTYPASNNIIYVEYLKAIIFYEQISDEKKDLKPLLDAEEQINFFINKYPDSDYSTDLKFKKDLIQNQLAAKELFVARYYVKVQKWIPAINRLKVIVKNYDKTIFIEEALHRLVEIHYLLGLEEEAKKYANILGYNYNSSEWFKQSYKILNEDYIIKKKSENTKEKNNFLKKLRNIIN